MQRDFMFRKDQWIEVVIAASECYGNGILNALLRMSLNHSKMKISFPATDF